ncbi:MAG: undecaprenyl-diphosphate phosphatase [Oscillospiraceae bacterium]
MTVLSAFLLGLVQGVAEFLPISSSGHLSIAQNLLGLSVGGEDLFFDVLLHLGTLAAVLVAYWGDVIELVGELFRGIGDLAQHRTPDPVPPSRRLLLLLAVGTLPLFAVLPVQEQVESLYGNLPFIGGALLMTGVLLFAADRVRRGRATEKSVSLLDVLLVGVGQAIATVPGISRSGMTIASGCLLGFDRRFAVRFSFLLSIPAVLGANLLHLVQAAQTGIDWSLLPVYGVGLVTAALSGYFCIRLLRLVAEKGKFGYFAYYCWAAGIFTLVLTAIK